MLGRKIGPNKILSAAKISNKRIYAYLDSVETVDAFINSNHSLPLNNKLFDVKRLVAPSKKLILSNVHTSLPNTLILEALRQYNIRTTSAIHDLHIGLNTDNFSSDELKAYTHITSITSFRRGVFIEANDQTILSDSITIYFENETHRIFINDNEQQPCHFCHLTSHIAAQCPSTMDTSYGKADPISSTQPKESDPTFLSKLLQARSIRDHLQTNDSSDTDSNDRVASNNPTIPDLHASDSTNEQPTITISPTSNPALTQKHEMSSQAEPIILSDSQDGDTFVRATCKHHPRRRDQHPKGRVPLM